MVVDSKNEWKPFSPVRPAKPSRKSACCQERNFSGFCDVQRFPRGEASGLQQVWSLERLRQARQFTGRGGRAAGLEKGSWMIVYKSLLQACGGNMLKFRVTRLSEPGFRNLAAGAVAPQARHTNPGLGLSSMGFGAKPSGGYIEPRKTPKNTSGVMGQLRSFRHPKS